ncbi:MAG TPA: Nif3-like dinuclear metal center hexameric protein, partial [Bacteroidales bacterium]|nr:Nif3-like dinuclear metal center hexameric protein [Bacteroidales bacterium]
ENEYDRAGAGMIGHLPEPTDEKVFLAQVKDILKIPVIRHSPLLGKPLRRVAICGGSGSFLIQDAIRMQADIFLTADIKYHQFFEADGKIVIADAGHFETEQFTCGLIAAYLKKKFPTFAIRISETLANPVNYF